MSNVRRYFSFLVIILIAFGLWFSFFRGKQIISTNSTLLTQPVNSFEGVIEKVNNTNITVKTTLGTAKGTTTYTVVPTENVGIFTLPLPSTSASTISSADPKTLHLSDLQRGYFVTITTNQDLRTTSNTTVRATSIAYHPVTLLYGKVTSVDGSLIKIETTGFSHRTIKSFVHSSYEIPISPRTKIVGSEIKIVGSRPEPIANLTPQDIKIGDVIKIEARDDIMTSDIIALSIEIPTRYPSSAVQDTTSL